MAQNYSPKIITDGLVMCLDPSLNKSYPTTDLPIKSGLLLWLDASDDTTFSYSSGTQVSQWRDKSGNNFHANQSTTAQQPLRNTTNNSRKSVFFNASTRLDFMTISSGISLPNDASIFIVYKPSAQSYQYAVLIDNYHGQGGAKGFVIQRVSTNSQFYYANGDGSGFVDTSASPWTYTDNIIQLLSLNKASSTGTPYISGTAQTSRTVYANTSQNTTGLAIGYWGHGGGRYYNGDMCEILIFNRSLTSTEMKQVHTYLGQKWGISNTDRSIIDLSGNNNNGLLGNGTTSDMPLFDVYNKGNLNFDGTNDAVIIANNFLPTNSSFSISTWVKIKIVRTSALIDSMNDSAAYDGFALWITSGGKFIFYILKNTVTSITSLQSYSTDTWYNVVAIYNQSTIAIYINGVLDVSTAYSSGFDVGTANIGLGRRGANSNDPTSCNIAQVSFYNRGLSAVEVAQNYEAQKSKFANTIVQQGLVLNLDAGNPYSYAGAGTTWYDVSGNNKIGTLTGGVTYSSIYGGDFILDGVNGYIQTDLNQNTDNAQITWEAWFWDNSPGGFVSNTAIISNYGPNATTPFTILHIFDNGIPLFGQRNSSGTQDEIYGLTSICNSIWHHVVGVVDNSNMLIYVDGVLQQTKTKITGTTTSGQNLVIGGNHLGRYQSCRIASARCYNIALSAAQVLQNYNATKGRFGL